MENKEESQQASFNQHVVQVTLIVKGEDSVEARRYAAQRLNSWFSEGYSSGSVPGYGYPNGTLLYYHFKGEHVAFSQGQADLYRIKVNELFEQMEEDNS